MICVVVSLILNYGRHKGWWASTNEIDKLYKKINNGEKLTFTEVMDLINSKPIIKVFKASLSGSISDTPQVTECLTTIRFLLENYREEIELAQQETRKGPESFTQFMIKKYQEEGKW